MTFTSKILERATLHQISSFLIYGAESNIDAPQDPLKWLNTTYTKLTDRLHREFPDDDTYDEIFDLVLNNMNAVQHTYMVLGMQTGIRLGRELFPERQ